MPTSLYVLPYFNGCGTPRNDRTAKGMITGLTLNTGRYEIAGAILEALAYELRLNMEYMKRSGIPVESVRCAGGGAKSPIGLQLKADVLNIPINTLEISEAACLGAAILAAAGAGFFDSPEDGAALVRTGRCYEPNKTRAKVYGEKYLEYKDLYLIQKQHMKPGENQCR
jgi:xylulokinase